MIDKKRIDESIEFLNQIDILENKTLDDLFSTTLKQPDDLNTDIKKIQDESQTELNCESYEDTIKIPILKPEKSGLEKTEAETKEKKKKNIISNVFFAILCIIISLLFVFLITKFVIHSTIVDGNSMNLTLQDGDRLLIDKLAYYIDSPSRFDIVVFEYSEEENYIKRIIGLPGETVQISDGMVYINGTRLEEDIYGNAPIDNPGIAKDPVVLNENEYFVLGDNRNNSIDSRKTDIGKVNIKKIDGRAIFRIMPFSKFGSIIK